MNYQGYEPGYLQDEQDLGLQHPDMARDPTNLSSPRGTNLWSRSLGNPKALGAQIAQSRYYWQTLGPN